MCYIAIIQTGVIFIMLTFPSASCISVIFLNHVNQIIRKLLFMQGRVGYIKQLLCICGMVIRFYSSSSCPECWPKTFFPPSPLSNSREAYGLKMGMAAFFLVHSVLHWSCVEQDVLPQTSIMLNSDPKSLRKLLSIRVKVVQLFFFCPIVQQLKRQIYC